MMILEMDKAVMNNVNENNIYDEIHRLEGRIDFLLFCKDIPEHVKERELNHANIQMNMLQAKLLLYGIKGVL